VARIHVGETPVRSGYNVGIKALPSGERPREKLLRHGAGRLTPQELLAIVLHSGTRNLSAISLAQQLLEAHNGLRGLSKVSVRELARVKGVGDAKAAQIAACVEIAKRLLEDEKTKDHDNIIRSPEDAAAHLRKGMLDGSREIFKALLLDTRNKIIQEVTISIGTLDSSIVHPREVFKEAIAASAAGILVGHNHPSGDLSPSPEDLQVTARLVEAGKLVGIEVLDHLILGDGHWVSLKERGYI
jgi:DNA repair protein RadC